MFNIYALISNLDTLFQTSGRLPFQRPCTTSGSWRCCLWQTRSLRLRYCGTSGTRWAEAITEISTYLHKD